MQLNSYVNFRLGLALVLTFCCTSSGCRSSTWKMPSWKMPGSKFFASRDPDPATLAGRSGVPELPESPATKYTASNIAAVGKSSAASGTNTGSNSSLAGGTTDGYASPTATPPAGLAAQGNGYQTGPYQVGATGGLATGGLATGTTVGSTSNTLASGPNGLPNPYGGTYAGTASPGRAGGTNEHLYGNTPAAGMPADIPLPNSVTSSLASGPNSPGLYPSAPGMPALPDTTSASYAAAVNPSPSMMPHAGLPPLPTGLPALPPPTGTAGSFDPTRTTTGGSFTLNTPNTATSVNNTPTPPSTAYQGATTLGFAPGTTGRSTTYNFSGNASGSSPASRNSQLPPNTSLPPNTATLPNAQPPRF